MGNEGSKSKKKGKSKEPPMTAIPRGDSDDDLNNSKKDKKKSKKDLPAALTGDTLDEDTLQSLKDKTLFSETELTSLFLAFRNAFGGLAGVPFETFQAMFSRIEPRTARHIYARLCRKHTELLRFKEAVKALSVLTRGFPTERFEWIFSLAAGPADAQTADRGELERVLEAFGAQGIHEGYATKSEVASSIKHIHKLPKTVTIEEFTAVCVKDSPLIQGLGLFTYLQQDIALPRLTMTTRDTEVAGSAQEQLIFTVACMRESIPMLGKLSMTDLTLGMVALARARPSSTAGDYPLFTDWEFLRYANAMRELVWLGYHPDELKSVPRIAPSDILRCKWASSHLKPAYYMAFDREEHSITIVVRGTNNVSDTLTDLAATAVPFHGGHGHKGMIAAAQWLLDILGEQIHSLIKQYPSYRVTCLGHSLGGGVASILGLLLKQQGLDVKVLTFAPAAVLTLAQAQACAAFSTAFILHDDVVPRFSFGQIEVVKNDIANYKWGKVLSKDASAAWSASVNVASSNMKKFAKTGKKYAGRATHYGMKKLFDRSDKGASSKSPAAPPPQPPPMETAATVPPSAQSEDLSLSVVKKTSSYPAPPPKRLNDGQDITSITLYPPGRLLHIVRNEKASYNNVGVYQKPQVEFGHIELSGWMLSDHKLGSYTEALQAYIDQKAP